MEGCEHSRMAIPGHLKPSLFRIGPGVSFKIFTARLGLPVRISKIYLFLLCLFLSCCGYTVVTIGKEIEMFIKSLPKLSVFILSHAAFSFCGKLMHMNWVKINYYILLETLLRFVSVYTPIKTFYIII